MAIKGFMTHIINPFVIPVKGSQSHVQTDNMFHCHQEQQGNAYPRLKHTFGIYTAFFPQKELFHYLFIYLFCFVLSTIKTHIH